MLASDGLYVVFCMEGVWVLVVQISSCVGLSLNVISLLLQLLNVFLNPRNKMVHMAALCLMAAVGTFLVIAGQICHNRSVWAERISLGNNAYVKVEAISSGLYLLSTVLAAWSCVISHVTSHGPGPVSKDTRFLHTLKEEPVAEPTPIIVEGLILEEPKMTEVEEEQMRKASVVSTAV